MNKLLLSTILILIIIGGAAFLISRKNSNLLPGEPVACTMDAKACPDGSFVGRVGPACEFEECPAFEEDSHLDLIRVASLSAGDLVTSPLEVRGEARGNWYFEASFPVKLLDGNGNVLVSHYAEAQGEWMTTEFVPFKTTLTFPMPTTATGTLILQKDNPSGEPQFDDQIAIPVRFIP